MKTLSSTRVGVAFALLLGCLATSAIAADLSKPASPVEVTFSNPDNYTDWKLSDGGNWYRQSVFPAIRSFLTQQAEPMLPSGDHLEITFTDMDLGHPAPHGVISIDSPSFQFSYRITNASGAEVRHGTENLRAYTDLQNYRYTVSTTDVSTEIIQREKPMLKAWALTALADLK
jgi:opacity protein-like surface antigen